MDDAKRNLVRKLIVVVCLVLAVIITLVLNNPFGGSGSGRVPIQMLCAECDAEFELSVDDYREQLMEKGIVPMGPMASPACVCSVCENETAYKAVTCKKCKTVFVPAGSGTQDYPDRCPDCGHSATEEGFRKLGG